MGDVSPIAAVGERGIDPRPSNPATALPPLSPLPICPRIIEGLDLLDVGESSGGDTSLVAGGMVTSSIAGEAEPGIPSKPISTSPSSSAPHPPTILVPLRREVPCRLEVEALPLPSWLLLPMRVEELRNVLLRVVGDVVSV